MSLNFQTKDAFTKNKANGWKYDIIGLGMKINLPDINAAIGLAQIRQYDKLLSERKRVANRYNNFFSTKKWAIIPPYKSATKETSFHIYPLRICEINETKRDKMIQFISEKGIAVNVHYIPLPMLTFFKNLGYNIDDFPQSYKFYSQEISLPIYPTLTNEQIDFIIESVQFAYENASAL
jgi:dTDP-4-amino-4,6-dideoxygalactose transaminase